MSVKGSGLREARDALMGMDCTRLMVPVDALSNFIGSCWPGGNVPHGAIEVLPERVRLIETLERSPDDAANACTVQDVKNIIRALVGLDEFPDTINDGSLFSDLINAIEYFCCGDQSGKLPKLRSRYSYKHERAGQKARSSTDRAVPKVRRNSARSGGERKNKGFRRN